MYDRLYEDLRVFREAVGGSNVKSLRTIQLTAAVIAIKANGTIYHTVLIEARDLLRSIPPATETMVDERLKADEIYCQVINEMYRKFSL